MDTEMLKLARQMKERPLSANERHWLEVIRLASDDADPEPTLALTQELRLLFESSFAGKRAWMYEREGKSGGKSPV